MSWQVAFRLLACGQAAVGFAKVRYRSVASNLARAFGLFALANLYLVRHQLLPPQARCVL